MKCNASRPINKPNRVKERPEIFVQFINSSQNAANSSGDQDMMISLRDPEIGEDSSAGIQSLEDKSLEQEKKMDVIDRKHLEELLEISLVALDVNARTVNR